jgi:hypothetical protein
VTRDRHGIRRLGETKILESDPRSEEPKRKRRPKPPPARPDWMDEAEYEALVAMREKLA